MKIKRLRIAGFGPYKNEQVVDFQRFDDDGIFLITGKTGAGKSSILDAVCFALYGDVPRYEGTESPLRSDYCEPADPTFVELDFSLGDLDYRVYRTPRYQKAKKRGIGTTLAQPDARLDLHGSEGWSTVATRPVEVGHELTRILPLKQDQFLQVILLAQNRFQKFLLAKTDDRTAVLRTLFGTIRFERLETDLINRRKALDEQLEAADGRLADLARAVAAQAQLDAPHGNSDIHWFETVQRGIDVQFGFACDAAQRAGAALAGATENVRALEDLRRRQDRRDAAAAEVAIHDGRSDSVDADQLCVRAANRAGRVWPLITARQEAEALLAAALVVEADARDDWRRLAAAGEGKTDAGTDAGTEAETDSTKATGAVIDALVGRLGSLGDVLIAENTLPGLDRDLADIAARLDEHGAALKVAEARLEALPDRLDTIDREQAAAALAAAREPEASATLARMEAARSAAAEASTLRRELERAYQTDMSAAAANTAVAAHFQSLVDRRLTGHAVELADQLVDGRACEVCGSTVHPARAVGDTEPVTERDIEVARFGMTAAQGTLEETRALIHTVTVSLAEARTRSGDRGIDQLQTDVAAAEIALGLARRAAVDEAELGVERLRLRGELDAAGRALVEAREARDADTTQLAARENQRTGIVDRVEAQRGECASVTELAGRLRDELRAVRAVGDATDRSREHRGVRAAAAAAAETQLAAEGFADEASAAGARLTEAALVEVEARIRRHDAGMAAALAVLAEPDLVGLPAMPVDSAPTREALAVAAAARDTTIADRASLAERVAVTTRLLDEARSLFEVSSDVLATQTQVRGLAAVVHGEDPNTKRMRLETFVLAAQLEQIIAAANGRLRTMTGGRYALEHDDSVQYRGSQSGLGLAIRDEHTGRARPTHSLSGGETFLASLALALGLAEVVSNQAGGIALDTLFVDEGFGSLDSATLETAMSTLDGLRAGGRTIGLISHVDSMKEQISAKLSIVVTDQGFSEIEPASARPAQRSAGILAP
jgi:exonuclease SbcC